MRKLHDIKFSTQAAKLVEQVLKRAVKLFPEHEVFGDHRSRRNDIRLALSKPSDGKTARGTFFIIHASRDGSAAVRRPRTKGHRDAQLRPLTQKSMDEILRDAVSWYGAVQPSKKPVSFANTEAKRVFAGGHFESKRREH